MADGRDLDPPEETALACSSVLRARVTELGAAALPDGPVIVHVDLDVIDPAELAGLRFPAPGGPSLRAVCRRRRRGPAVSDRCARRRRHLAAAGRQLQADGCGCARRAGGCGRAGALTASRATLGP